MIEFRNGFGYKNPKVFHILLSISFTHNKLNNCYNVHINLFKRGYTFTIGKRRK